MTEPDSMVEDSFEKARAAFFGTEIATPRPTEPPTEFPKMQNDSSRKDAPAKD